MLSASGSGGAIRGIDRRAVGAWILYDLANTLFSFVVLSFYFGPWLVDDLGARDSAVTVSQSVAMAVVLLAAPVLGAITDRTRRMPFLVASTLVAVVMTPLLGAGDLLGLGTARTIQIAIGVFVVANIGYQLGLVFYDALLPVVSTPQTMGRIGSWGVGIGYLGSFVGLTVGGVLLARDADAEPWLFVATGALFLVFALPCFFWVRERRPKAPLPPGVVSDTMRQVVARIRELPRIPNLGRFLVARVLYADAVNTLLLILGIYAVTEAGFETATAAYSILLALGIVLAVVTAPLWGILVDRAGARHTLRLVLVVWMLCLGLVALHPVLDLPRSLFFVYGALVGIGLAGTWSSDRPLLVAMAPKEEVGAWFGLYALAGRFAAIIGPLLYSLVVDVLLRDHPRARPVGVLVLFVQVLASWYVLRRLPDPVYPGAGPFARFVPWAGEGPLRRSRWWRVRAVPVYLVVSWVLFVRLAEVIDGVWRVPAAALERWVFSIPDLTEAPASAFLTLVTAPWFQHDVVQIVYVSLLLLLFGLAFEAREGTRRFLEVFVGTTFVGAITAGVALHVIYPEVSTHEVFADAWGRTWSGGSVGAFGIMGALAARARTPWPLLAFFVVWELNVGWWYLRSYTPAFHLTALVAGFAWTRWVRRGPTGRAPPAAPVAPEGAAAERLK